MAPRKDPSEQDYVASLRDIRERLADIQKGIINSTEKQTAAINALIESMAQERLTRRKLEAEEAENHANLKKKLVEEMENGGTTERVKAIVEEKLNEGKINWAEIWKKNVVPTSINVITVAVLVALLATIAPGLAQFILDAFGRIP